MSGRTIIRLLIGSGLALTATLAAIYLLNPLHTASHDPRLRSLGFMLYRMPSRSMEPAIHPNNLFVVSAWAYRKADPKPGDIVVFQYPLDPAVVFAKRVIAGGGTTVEVVDGVPVVNGKPLEEPYVDPRNNTTPYSRTMSRIQVPANNFFIMGDNRDASTDSRSWGVVPRSRILGKVE